MAILGLLVVPQTATASPEVQTIPTRPGVTVKVLLDRPAGAASGVLIMFPGASGAHAFKVQDGSVKLGKNFLVRSSPRFVRQGWAAAIVDAPSDRAEGMSDAFRSSPDHVKDIRAVMDFLDKQGLGPIYLAGTSRGTLSAAYVAAMLSDPRLKGLVLMSTVGEDLSAALLQKITVPVLLVHHRDDGCMKAPFQAAVRLKGFFTRSPRVDFIEVQGGLQSESDPCLPMSYHGFLGKEKEVVKAVIDWLAGKGAPGRIGP